MYTLSYRNIYKPFKLIKIMKTIKLLKILERYPVFTVNDLARILNKKQEYIKTLLYRLKKRDLVYRLERNKYTIYDDAFLVASLVYFPSYISLWSALRFYNLTEQLPKKIFVVVSVPRKPLKFQDTIIEFIKIKHFFGFKKERYKDFDIFIAEPEKAIIDSFLLKKIPFDEIENSVKDKQINKNKLINYALKIKNKTLIKRLGFLLEENNFKCNKLRKFIDNNYVLLDFALLKKGRKNNKWRIIDNRK